MKVNTFLLFHYYLSWKRVGPFIWRHLNPLNPRMLCAKFGWNWSGGSSEEDFKFQIFYYFSIISPSVMVWPLNHFVCQVWSPIYFMLAQWPVLEKKNSKYCQFIFAISLLFTLGNGRGPSFEQTWTPFTRGCFVPSLVEIGLVVLEKKMKM